MAKNRSLSVTGAARVLGIAPVTCKRLIESGRLKALTIQCNKQKRYRIRQADLEAFVEKAARCAAGFQSPDGKTSYL